MDVVANNNATANNAEISVSSAASGDSVNRNVLTGAKSKNGHVHSHTMQMNGKSHQSKDGLEKKKPIRLQSPVGAQSVTWNWSADAAGSIIGIEVLDIIRLVICHYPEFDEPLKGRLENVDISNYDQVRSLAKKFNKILNQTNQIRKEGPSKVKSREILHQIVTRCYNRAVDNEKALNKHYEAFSSQTYGETSFERMKMIIDEIKPTEKDVFVDLGSGVGQLVIQMAGGSQVQKAVGIEIANLPADFARKLESEFKKWMNWFGRQFRPFQLKHGDFLNEEYRRLITEEATIIFVNNFAFQSDLELRIKRELLSDLKQGTRIISTKPYVPLNKQGAITDRQLNDISVITDVAEMKACPNPCSWTSAYVPYYLHTINRKKLEMYFTQRNSSLRCKSSDVGSRRSSTPNSKTSNSRESSLDVRDKSSDIGRINGEDICFGPTTRRKWHEYVNDLEQQKKRKGGAGSSSTPDERSVTNSSSSTPTPLGVPAAPASAPSSLINHTINNLQNIVAPQKIFIDNSLKKSSVIELVNSIKEEPFAESSPPLVDTTPTNALILTSNTLHQQQNQSLIGSPKFEPITPVTNKHDGDGGSGKKQSAKRSYERKEKVPTAAGGKRGRPSKADKMLGTHTSPKMPRLSDDAKDGMEVMHQMTLSVQAGKPLDPASILADMVEARRLTTSINTPDIILPFPNLNGASAGPSHPGGDVHSQKYAERYPGLTKFLEKMKGVYENMFDDFYASKRAANDVPGVHANTTKDTPAKSYTDSSSLHFRSILDQTPVKRHLAEDLVDLGSSGGSGSSGGWHPIAASDDKSLSRIEQCEKRVEGCRKRVAEKFQDFQAEIQQLNEEVDTLLNELRQQHQQRQIDSQTQQKQLQHQQILAQQQLIASAQVQLAATQQSVAAQQHQPQSFQQQQAVNAQMNQALIAAVTNNQLELIINEIQAQYSRQLTAQQLLVQLSQLNFLGNIPPQDISTLQSIASGAALNEVVHQMSPVAAVTLHSPLSSAGGQKLPPGPSPVQQHLATVVSNSNGSVGVQNFLSSLESLNNVSAGCSATPTNVCANLSAVAVEVGHTASNLGANSTSPTGSSQHHPIGQPTSLTLRQVSQNFPCPSSGITSSAVPTSSCSQSVSGASTSQLTRESTVAEVVAEVAALPTTVPRKPFRPRPARTSGVGGKRGGQNAQKQQTADDPKKQEEIERQIQAFKLEVKDIVAKALEVDSAAKYAEKERKARGGEKRSKDKNGSAAAVSTLIPSTSSTSTLPTTTSSALLDKALPPVIMQNFLTAAVAAQRKQLQQQQSLSCGYANDALSLDNERNWKSLSVASGCVNDFQLHSIDGPSINQQLQQPIETQSPSSSTASISMQSHFPFTPSSISLAIQGAGLVGSQQFTASNSSMGTPQPPMTTTERNNSSPMFLHPKGSCSPPFISLNLPPTTSAALVTPPTNVVVKVEPKLPPISTSGGGCNNGLLSAPPSTMP